MGRSEKIKSQLTITSLCSLGTYQNKTKIPVHHLWTPVLTQVQHVHLTLALTQGISTFPLWKALHHSLPPKCNQHLSENQIQPFQSLPLKREAEAPSQPKGKQTANPELLAPVPLLCVCKWSYPTHHRRKCAAVPSALLPWYLELTSQPFPSSRVPLPRFLQGLIYFLF